MHPHSPGGLIRPEHPTMETHNLITFHVTELFAERPRVLARNAEPVAGCIANEHLVASPTGRRVALRADPEPELAPSTGLKIVWRYERARRSRPHFCFDQRESKPVGLVLHWHILGLPI